VIHLRLILDPDLVPTVLAHLRRTDGVAHVIHLSTHSTSPAGDLVLCDVVREAADGVIEWLQDHHVHRHGAIVIEAVEAVVSDAAAAAEARAPGSGADSLVWEELESRARGEAELSASYLIFMAVASVIATIGIILDSPILIVGAMVVGPEYGPLSALCVAGVRKRADPAWRALRTLALGLVLAAAAALVFTVMFRVIDWAPDAYRLEDRELTSFISKPDGLAAVVAVLAGIVGMLSLTEGRAGALVGVLVSVTTIPAAANVGLAACYGEWPEVGGAALQLAVNFAGLVIAGVTTLALQARLTTDS
jgi:uncharacterized hydrophobic protein (TIGR00271 family)